MDPGMAAAKFEPTLTLESVRQGMADFVAERDWGQASFRPLPTLASCSGADSRRLLSVHLQFHTPRNLVLALTGELGELCEIFQWKGECASTDDWPAAERVHLGEELSDVLLYLVRLADQCGVDFPAALSDKIVKNGIKYPLKSSQSDGGRVALPHVEAPRASADPAPPTSAATLSTVQQPSLSRFEPTLTLELLRSRVAAFSDARGWNDSIAPRSLLLALTGEVGELCEIFQWKGESKTVDDWSAKEKEHLGEELSDVMIYLVRLADTCNVDLSSAIKDKMAKNATKYPATLVKGSSKKYNQYKHAQDAA